VTQGGAPGGDDLHVRPGATNREGGRVVTDPPQISLDDATASIQMLQLVVVTAGVSDPSSSRLLGDRIAQRCIDNFGATGRSASVRTIEVASLAVAVAKATVSGRLDDSLNAAVDKLVPADAVIAVTPIYKAGVSGLFKAFIDLLDSDLLVAKPMILAATAGTPRHALVVDEEMRSLFAYFRAMTTPTAVFASPEDWASSELGTRIERAATELAVLVGATVADEVVSRAWSGYQHQFGSRAAAGARTENEIDLDTSLMRLAAGGKRPPPSSETSGQTQPAGPPPANRSNSPSFP
jgi:FMN reductase